MEMECLPVRYPTDFCYIGFVPQLGVNKATKLVVSPLTWLVFQNRARKTYCFFLKSLSKKKKKKGGVLGKSLFERGCGYF
jgi:hypothetical protein